MHTVNRQRWPRLTIVLSPERSDELVALARRNLRDPRREALRLVLDGLDRESARKREAIAR
jgi:hypothetical protein